MACNKSSDVAVVSNHISVYVPLRILSCAQHGDIILMYFEQDG